MRLATHREQMINQSLRSNNHSGFKGVSFHKRNNAYRGYYRDENGRLKNTKRFYLDDYGTEEDCKLSCYNHLQEIKKSIPSYNFDNDFSY